MSKKKLNWFIATLQDNYNKLTRNHVDQLQKNIEEKNNIKIN